MRKSLLFLLPLFPCAAAFADVTLPPLISDNMLLQRPIAAVWGKADAYLKVERKYNSGHLYPPALLGTGIQKKEWEKRLTETDKKESAHRQYLKTQ